MYERPPTSLFQNPTRNTTFPLQRYTLMFQQHQDESIYDAWTRFKNLIQRVPYHGLDLLSLTQFFYDHVDDYTRMDLDFAEDENLRELSGEQVWEAIENFAQGQKEWDNPPNFISKQELANLKARAKRLFENEEVWVEMHRGIADMVENPKPQRLLIEVQPLEKTSLEDLGLNTCNHDTPLSSREIPSFDKLEPQLQPFPSFPSLEVVVGDGPVVAHCGPPPLTGGSAVAPVTVPEQYHATWHHLGGDMWPTNDCLQGSRYYKGSVRGSGIRRVSTRFRVYKVVSQSQAAT
ncbi:hypothetical protein Tco_0760039 [Tanacetum coccineum]